MGPLVVAVSGTSGAGKSTLVEDLSQRLRGLGYHLEIVHVDDFIDEADLPGDDVSGWLARGAQPSDWRADGMEQHLLDLVTGCIDGPGPDEAVTVVLVEEPFVGRDLSSAAWWISRSTFRCHYISRLHVDSYASSCHR